MVRGVERLPTPQIDIPDELSTGREYPNFHRPYLVDLPTSAKTRRATKGRTGAQGSQSTELTPSSDSVVLVQ